MPLHRLQLARLSMTVPDSSSNYNVGYLWPWTWETHSTSQSRKKFSDLLEYATPLLSDNSSCPDSLETHIVGISSMDHICFAFRKTLELRRHNSSPVTHEPTNHSKGKVASPVLTCLSHKPSLEQKKLDEFGGKWKSLMWVSINARNRSSRMRARNGNDSQPTSTIFRMLQTTLRAIPGTPPPSSPQ